MKEFLAMFKLYSMQAITFIAGLNSVLAYINAPLWFVGLVNVCGVIATYFARKAPQPAVEAELKAAKAAKV